MRTRSLGAASPLLEPDSNTDDVAIPAAVVFRNFLRDIFCL
jgi:hypothetical protein